jgi:chromosome segregation ATPase
VKLNLGILIPAIGAIAAAVGAYAADRWQKSGRIRASDADILWGEGKAMREELRNRAVALELQVALLQGEAGTHRAETSALRQQVINLQTEALGHRESMSNMSRQLAEVNAQLTEVNAQLAEVVARQGALDAEIVRLQALVVEQAP